MKRPLLIRNGRVLDPSQNFDSQVDILILDGSIAFKGENIKAPEDAQEIDASGLLVTPGLIDVHVHFREPGGEHKETIATGARAAGAGGFTAVCAMPNTNPVVDDPAGVGFVIAQATSAKAARVYPLGSISLGQKGNQLAAIGEMVDAGAVGITDDGNPVMNSGLMRRAMEYAQAFDIPVADHPEDLSLSGQGVMNEGLVSTRLGLRGKPNASEDIHIIRDLLLAELTGGRIHIQHVSTAYGVEEIRKAKARGVRVTAEASPHHLVLTDEEVENYNTDAKMNPPLRSSSDRKAVRQGLADGTLCVIATDHAPHHYDEKEQAFDDAPNGIVGLETSLGVLLTHLVRKDVIDLPTLVDRMSCAPARAFGIPGGTLSDGSIGDVTIIDLEDSWVVDKSSFLSKSHNTPFHGWDLKGRAKFTIVGGEIVWKLDT
tara:strand:- start:1104 stop:2393 length:1290 start_codon:yes stop_codon:yes gene_type:complete